MTSIDRIRLPTPFGVGAVNCYLLPASELTVIDPGPETADAREALRSGLDERGHSVDDIANVLITHPHMDHFGGARRLADEADARVVAHGDAVERLSSPTGQFEDEQGFFHAFLRSMGMPEDTVETVLTLPESYTDFQRPVTPDRTVADGERLAVGVTLDCVHTPGHAVGSVCYRLRSENAVFTGDHVLPDITPNPTLTTLPGRSGERTRSLPTYLASLDKLRAVDETVGYGGHGERMEALQKRIDETISHHHERKEHIAGMIPDAGKGTTAYRLMNELFPELPATEGFVGISEIVGHLDLLDDEGRLDWHETDGVRKCVLAD